MIVSNEPRAVDRLTSIARDLARRRTAWYLVLMVVVVVLFYWKTLLTHQYTMIIGSEGVNLTYSWLHFWVASIRQGHIPLWDPYEFAGSPFAASLQPSAYYPLQLLFALAPLKAGTYISAAFYHQYLALAHVLCAWFMFALLRELRCSRFAAFIGGCVFSMSGLLVRMMWPMYIESCIWLPAIFLFLLRALRTERRPRALLEAGFCGFCLAMSIFTGGMAFFIMQAICVVTGGAWWGAMAGRRTGWVRAGSVVAVAVAVALGLSAVQLLPANEYGKLTLRFIDGGQFPTAQKIPYERLVPGLWPQSLVSGLFPVAFDGKIGGEEVFAFYVGVVPLFLAIIAIWKRRDSIWVRYLAGLAVLAFAYSMGESSPLHGVLYAIVPLLWVTRSANRFFYLISFALAVLAAFGLDAVLSKETPSSAWLPAKPYIKWIAIAAGTALVAPGIYRQMILSQWNAFSLLLILGSCGWLAFLFARPAGTSARFLLAAFILFDLSAFNWIQFSKAALEASGDKLEQMVSLRGPAEFVKAQPGRHRVRVGVPEEPNIGDVYGVEAGWGGGATALTVYSELGVRDDLLNIVYYIRPVSFPAPGAVYNDGKWKVYQNPRAFPRAWMVHQIHLVSGESAAFRALDNPEIDLHQTAIVETPVPGRLGPAPAEAEPVRFDSYEAERMSLEVKAADSGLLVLSEMYYPGWVARVNGKPAEIHKVDGALRGIAMAPGVNRIELEYSPFNFRAGAAISLFTLAGLGAGWLLVRLRRE